MSSEVLVIRFPTGDAEFYSGVCPSSGDRLIRREAEWVVTCVDLRPGSHMRVNVAPVAVRRDESWPTPYDFVRG